MITVIETEWGGGGGMIGMERRKAREREREMQEENKTGWVQYISLTAVIIRQQEEPAGHHS